jgi:hypothetical protein
MIDSLYSHTASNSSSIATRFSAWTTIPTQPTPSGFSPESLAVKTPNSFLRHSVVPELKLGAIDIGFNTNG